MLAWFGELNVKERRTMGACFGGWALDAFDVQMYSFVIPTVIALWGVSRGQAGLIGTVSLLISSLGGWFSGTLADRFGRVRMLQITILWYSIFTFLCAFAQNFEQLFVLRALHGLGFGGEWAAGAVLMGEVIRDKYRGRGVGIVQTGWAVGWGASALIYTALYAFLPEAIAWRFYLDRPVTGNLRLLDPPPHRRARDLPRPPAHSSDNWGRPPCFPPFMNRICGPRSKSP
jgi:MFS family permease